jgi:hypothetical protein
MFSNYTVRGMKNHTCVWRNIYIPRVLRTRGIINISPNTRAIFHFSNRVISYTNQTCDYKSHTRFADFVIARLISDQIA